MCLLSIGHWGQREMKNIPTFRKLNTWNIIQRFCGNRKYKNKCVFPLTFSMMFPDDHLRSLLLAYSMLINMDSLAYSPIMESYCLRIYTTGKGLGRCCLKSPPPTPLVLKPDILGELAMVCIQKSIQFGKQKTCPGWSPGLRLWAN